MDFSNLFCSTFSSSSIPSNFDLKFCFQQSLSQTPSFEEGDNLLFFKLLEESMNPTSISADLLDNS